MKINEFIDMYKKAVNDASRTKLCQSIITRTYVPALEKYAAIQSISDETMEVVGNMAFVNSVLSYIAYVMTTLSLYTSLDWNDIDSIDAYDLLTECGAKSAILLAIPSEELEELERINGLVLNDRDTNLRSEYAALSAFTSKIDAIVRSLKNYQEASSDITE